MFLQTATVSITVYSVPHEMKKARIPAKIPDWQSRSRKIAQRAGDI
jgi:hypothetical protein